MYSKSKDLLVNVLATYQGVMCCRGGVCGGVGWVCGDIGSVLYVDELGWVCICKQTNWFNMRVFTSTALKANLLPSCNSLMNIR